MKLITLTSLLLAGLLCGCGTTGGNNPQLLTPTLVQIAVTTGTEFGVEKYPQAVPVLRVATPIVCSVANGTNVQPEQIVAALQSAGIGTNIEATVIINGALAIYSAIFNSYGSSWQANQPTLTLYLKAVCDGLSAGLPSPTARREALPPHL